MRPHSHGARFAVYADELLAATNTARPVRPSLSDRFKEGLSYEGPGGTGTLGEPVDGPDDISRRNTLADDMVDAPLKVTSVFTPRNHLVLLAAPTVRRVWSVDQLAGFRICRALTGFVTATKEGPSMTLPNAEDTHFDTDTAAVSKAYHDFLVAHGPDFAVPVLLHDAFHGTERLAGLLLEALRTVAASADGSVRLRAFDGFALDYRLTNTLVTTPVGGYPDASAWLRAHGGQTACVAVNQLARWNIELATWYIDRIRELIALGGHLGTETMDTYTFVTAGQGWTPFGIHNDYEPSFIYHLGPEPKTAWVWPDGQPAGAVLTASPALNGVCFDIVEHLPTANRYVMHPGDFLAIPAGLYHVFENTGPSAFLGITVFPTDVERIFGAALQDGDHTDHGRPPAADLFAVRDTVAAIADRLHTQALKLPARYDRRLCRLQSSGFTHPPHPHALAALADPSRADRFSTRFPGVFAPVGEGDQIYVYGRPMRTGLSHDATALCRFLNTLQETRIADVAHALDAPVDTVTALFARLALLGGLTS